MNKRFGKLFRNISDGQIENVVYNIGKENYYDLIKREQVRGFCQCIITSDIMISLSEYFLIFNNCDIISIEFSDDDEDLEQEISVIIRNLKENKAYWVSLKDKLEYLKEDSINIKKIDYKKIDTGEIFSIYVNGIYCSSDDMYEKFSLDLSKHVARCIG